MEPQLMENQLRSRRPKDTPFFQQRLPAWQPMFTAKKSGIAFLIYGLIFIIIGIPLQVTSNNLIEYDVDYTDCENSAKQKCSSVKQGTTCLCVKTVNITSPIRGNVLFYYGLKNFYQNHRRYVRSRSDSQLLGIPLSPDSLSSCDPYARYENSSGAYAILPCGAIANSIFNDSFIVQYNTGETSVGVGLTQKGIAWQSDVNVKYKKLGPEALKNTVKPPNWNIDITQRSSNPFTTDEALMVWMRTAALPSFRKLYGIFKREGLFVDGLPAGVYQVTIDYAYPVISFNGRKSFVIADASVLGGKNSIMGIIYVVTGTLYVLLAVAFLLVHWMFAAPKNRNNTPILSQ